MYSRVNYMSNLLADHRLACPGNSWTDKKKDGNSQCLLPECRHVLEGGGEATIKKDSTLL